MQVADPAVSQCKFEREVGHLRSLERTLTSRGIWVMDATFPFVKVAFVTARMKPRVITASIRVDFTDYDARPLSVKFWDPFEDRELLACEMMTNLGRKTPPPSSVPAEVGDHLPILVTPLFQAYAPNLPGFLCLPGIREYHDHPGHSGDPWELHRGLGDGNLFSIVDTVWRYGAAPFTQIGFAIQLQQAEAPE